MLDHAILVQIGDLMESWAAAYENAAELNKAIASLDAKRAIQVDKLAAEEEKARVAEEALNGLLEDIDDPEEESQVQELAKEKLFSAMMMDVSNGL